MNDGFTDKSQCEETSMTKVHSGVILFLTRCRHGMSMDIYIFLHEASQYQEPRNECGYIYSFMKYHNTKKATGNLPLQQKKKGEGEKA